jgi:putative Holliday junction resolvase
LVILALDYGERRIGVAVSDPLGIAAHGLDTIERSGDGKEFERIAELVAERKAERIVVGLPRNMDGSLGPAARRVMGFVKELRRRLPNVPVETIDERLSSVQAHRALSQEGVTLAKRAERVDRMAAQLILMRYLKKQEQQG